ncbi:hypothetical protein CMV_009043 [Castanea mollissima]|uniref:Uncharacterized protein n=1 Tax=Castanea mollissima TaxID=60419 RepID=A0A8J4VRC1_9ROSI|nr:hypothetical protein CMV_009043 [Castanea mollissima]
MVSLYSSMYICYSVLSVSTGSQFSVPASASFFISLARTRMCSGILAAALFDFSLELIFKDEGNPDSPLYHLF